MNLETVQREIETWDGDSLRKLMLFVASLRRQRVDPVRSAELARTLDDTAPAHWVGMDEVNRRLNDSE